MNPRILIAGPEAKLLYLAPYFEAVRLTGGEPELGWPKPDSRDDTAALKHFLRRYNGILLPGGNDIDPEFYGEKPHPKLGPLDRELDLGHLALARAALEFEWPMLAICRGMQVSAVAVGAALYQDLPDQFPSDIETTFAIPRIRLSWLTMSNSSTAVAWPGCAGRIASRSTAGITRPCARARCRTGSVRSRCRLGRRTGSSRAWSTRAIRSSPRSSGTPKTWCRPKPLPAGFFRASSKPAKFSELGS